jgi:hypothetical protein
MTRDDILRALHLTLDATHGEALRAGISRITGDPDEHVERWDLYREFRGGDLPTAEEMRDPETAARTIAAEVEALDWDEEYTERQRDGEDRDAFRLRAVQALLCDLPEWMPAAWTDGVDGVDIHEAAEEMICGFDEFAHLRGETTITDLDGRESIARFARPGIEWTWKRYGRRSAGSIELGKPGLVSKRDRALAGPEGPVYRVELALDAWLAWPERRGHTLHHELTHLDGKLTDGTWRPKIRKHDVQDFIESARRFAPGAAGVEYAEAAYVWVRADGQSEMFAVPAAERVAVGVREVAR